MDRSCWLDDDNLNNFTPEITYTLFKKIDTKEEIKAIIAPTTTPK